MFLSPFRQLQQTTMYKNAVPQICIYKIFINTKSSASLQVFNVAENKNNYYKSWGSFK
jgi:hypothetical protein